MHLLGRYLQDHRPVRIALCRFYGIGPHLSERLMARLQINYKALVSDLTEPQITALSAYLSSPSTTPRPKPAALSVPPPPPGSITFSPPSKGKSVERFDPLDDLKIETDLKKAMLADIAHERDIGTYKGKRIAQGFPVRGQRTKTNANTARRLNRVERRKYTTVASPLASVGSSTPSYQSLPFGSSKVLAALRSLQ